MISKKTFKNIDELINEFHLIDGMSFDIRSSSITDFCYCEIERNEKLAPFNECWIESIGITNQVFEDGLYKEINVYPEINISFRCGVENVYAKKHKEWCDKYIKEIRLYYNK